MIKKLLILVFVIAVVGFGFVYLMTDDDYYRQEQAVTQLNCLKSEDVPLLYSLKEGLVLADDSQQLSIVDIMKDEIVSSMQLDERTMQGVYQDKIVINNGESFDVYNDELEKIDTIAVKYTDGCFDEDLSHYYYLDHSALFVLDLKTLEDQQFVLKEDMRFSQLSSLKDHYLVCHPYTTHLMNNSCLGIIDLDTGEFEFLNDHYFDVEILDDQRFFANYDDNNVYYTYNVGKTYYYIPTYSLGKNRNYYYLSNSSYLFDIGEVSENSTDGDMIIYNLDSKIQTCYLKDYDYNHACNSLVYLKEENLIVGYHDSLVIFDLRYLEFDDEIVPEVMDVELKNQEILDNYNQEMVTTVKNMEKANEKVKEIEDKYNVDIVISSDCKAEILDSSGFYTTSTDKDSFENEEQSIIEALGTVDKALAHFPKDFFKNFVTRAGDRQLHIYLVGEIESTYSVIGYEFESGFNQNVACNIKASNLEGTICHEVWHAVENVLVAKNSSIFDDWSNYNPSGFKYLEIYEGYDDYNQYKYTYYGETNMNNVYFIDPYSCTFDKEDRARIMEYFMTMDEDTINELNKSTHLVKKYARLQEALKELDN